MTEEVTAQRTNDGNTTRRFKDQMAAILHMKTYGERERGTLLDEPEAED